MTKTIQNLVVLLEPSEDIYNVSSKGARMCLNRFCIDEDAAFELSGVYYLEKSSTKIIFKKDFEVERKTKGNGYLSLKLTVSMRFDSFYSCKTF